MSSHPAHDFEAGQLRGHVDHLAALVAAFEASDDLAEQQELALQIKQRTRRTLDRAEITTSEMTVGTPDYDGRAFFWGSNDCKFVLRAATAAERRRVHAAWLAGGLDLTGETDDHLQLMEEAIGVRGMARINAG